MRLRKSRRKTVYAFSVAATAAALVAVGTPAMAAESPVFNGFGRAMTAQRAVDKAIDDAENSASSEGLFDCGLIAQPIVWAPDPSRGEVSFTASVDMTCT